MKLISGLELGFGVGSGLCEWVLEVGEDGGVIRWREWSGICEWRKVEAFFSSDESVFEEVSFNLILKVSNFYFKFNE